MSPSASTSCAVVMALETSESPSPSRSSPFTSVVSEMRLVEGEEAMALKPADVRNVSSLIMLKPTSPGLLVVPLICMLMYEVGIEFHASNDAWSAVVASARDKTGAPSGFGIGLSVLFILY